MASRKLAGQSVWKPSRDAPLRIEPNTRGESSGGILAVFRAARRRGCSAQIVRVRRSRLIKPVGLQGARRIAILLGAGIAVFCQNSCVYQQVKVTPTGIVHKDVPIELRFTSAQEKMFISKHWNIASFNAKVTAPKTGPKYETSHSYDYDDDGSTDRTEDVLLYDLHLEHDTHAGDIAVRTIPIHQNLKTKRLDVLMQKIVDELSYVHYSTLSLSALSRSSTAAQYTVKVLKERAITLDQKEAYDATFEIANYHQLKIDPTQRVERIRMVIVRPGYDWEPKGEWARYRKIKYPVLTLISYSNLPGDFGKAEPDFEHFLKLVKFGT
jgi:hypothetical protein